ncbi:hypothetical protein GJ744_007439 [Endocarpon pusillum]|uniref:Heterokaryon incompatibility domain-containing protein n=1 Tax=Endocarpon pusillum TaxID=364733 RepID=A0A8H7AKD8_9EURO|nr:hypothetical protein GJ744_007439 [Endocarpon pusillum]
MPWRELWTSGWRTASYIPRGSSVVSKSTRLRNPSQTVLFCPLLDPVLSSRQKRQYTSHKHADFPNSLPAFCYDPLPITDPENSSNPAFRLLELHPGQESEEVQCTLIESRLLNKDPYETISYRWDDAQTTIVCNGRALSIRRSLAGALRALRYRDQPRLLWADAICIQQDDNAEKDNQVQLMRRIYSQAQGVLVWLGETAGDGNSHISVSWPARLAILGGLVTLRPRMNNSNPSAPYVRVRNVRKGTMTVLAPFSVELYLLLVSFLRKSWFRRAWVVQEVVVSKKVTCVWGSQQCEWKEVTRALEFMSKARFPLVFMPTLQHIAGIEEEMVRYKEGANTLLGLLLRHQRCLSTNPRDKVYAFCSLMGTSPSEFIDVRIRYGDAVESVYRDVATKILQHDRNLDILSHSPSPSTTSSSTSNLPSWIPDWSRRASEDMAHGWGIRPLSLASREMYSHHPPKPPFTAAKDSTYTPSPSPCLNSLTVSGYTFDTIATTGPVFNGVQVPSAVTTLRDIVLSWLRTHHTFYHTRDVLRAWEEIADARSQRCYTPDNHHHHHHKNTKPTSNEPILTAFYRTISTSEYDHSPDIRSELHIWNRVNRQFPLLRKLHLDTIVLMPYWIALLLWYGATDRPLLKFELQKRNTLYRRLIRTERGYLGLAGNGAQVGDRVVLCRGSRVPLVLRPVEPEASSSTAAQGTLSYRLVADAYVHGIMQGQGFDESSCASMVLV